MRWYISLAEVEMKNALMLGLLALALPVVAEQMPLAPHLERQATLTVIERNTLLTRKSTYLYDEPGAKGDKKSVPAMTILYPTGQKQGVWLEVDDDYDKYGPAGDRGWVRAADVMLFTTWKGN